MNSREKELTLRLCKGDREAFGTLFRMYHPKVRALALGMLKSESEAEDLAQDVFVKLWNERARLDKVEQFGSYLFVLSKNMLYTYIERKQTQRGHFERYNPHLTKEPSPHDNLEMSDLQLLIEMVVEAMPKQRQTIYRLSREYGLSNGEIAEKLSITKKTVENHLNSALKELRTVIDLVAIMALSHWV